MKNGWWCVTVFWKNGKVQSIWTKSERVAWKVVNDILEVGNFEKIKMTPEQEKPDENH